MFYRGSDRGFSHFIGVNLPDRTKKIPPNDYFNLKNVGTYRRCCVRKTYPVFGNSNTT